MSKREPNEVWKALVKEAHDDEAEFQQAAGAKPEEVDAELGAQGLDPKAEREAAGDWRREIEQRVALRKAREGERRTSTRPRSRSRPGLLLLVATVAAAIGGGLVYALTHPAPPPPPPIPAPLPEPPPVDSVVADPLVAAATLRENAFAECEAKQWDKCLANLDRARALDSVGDDAPRVKQTRDRAIQGIMHRSDKQ